MKKSLLQSTILSAFLCLMAWAQAPTGTITGRVTDASGAAVPGAKITLEVETTGFKQTQTSDANGRFVQTSLLPGVYRVTGEKSGFSKNVTSGIDLDASQTVTIDIAFKVGDVATTVEVTADVAQLKTETSSASTTITSKMILDLPTGRNPFSVATLTAGVIPGGGSTPWISGGRNAIDGFLGELKSDPRFADIDHKESFCDEAPFYRSKVKLKKRVVVVPPPSDY